MYRTRKFRKNGGTNKKNPANTKSSKRRQRVNTKYRKRKNLIKRRGTKKAGVGSPREWMNKDGYDPYGNRNWEDDQGYTDKDNWNRSQGYYSDDEPYDMPQRKTRSNSPPPPPPIQPGKKKVPIQPGNNKVIGLTGAALVTIAALLANSKDASTPVPPPPPVKFEEAQAEILESIDMRLKEKDVSNTQRKNMKEVSDILRATPQQGTYSSDPSQIAKSQEEEREKEKQYNEAMKQLRRRQNKGKHLPKGAKWEKFRPKPL